MIELRDSCRHSLRQPYYRIAFMDPARRKTDLHNQPVRLRWAVTAGPTGELAPDMNYVDVIFPDGRVYYAAAWQLHRIYT